MTERRILNELASRFQVDLGKHRQSIVCPFHGDKNPSLSIWLAPPGSEHVHCFSCSFHGSIARFLATVDGVSVAQKLRELGVQTDPRVAALDFITDEFSKGLDTGEVLLMNGEKELAFDFLSTVRGHNIKLLKKMRVGVVTREAIEKIQSEVNEGVLAKLKLLVGRKKKNMVIPVGAVVFPVIIAGEVLALRWKRYAGHPLVGKEVGQMHKDGWIRFIRLYNFDAINYETENLFIVEGEDDVLRILAAGGMAVGLCGGASQRDPRLKYLKNTAAKRIILSFDNDDDGEKYRTNVMRYLKKEGREAWFYIPEANDIAKDLDSLSLDEILANTKEAVSEFRESQGAYWDGGIKLSTFVFDLKAKIVGEDEIYIVTDVRGEKEPEAKTIIIPNRLIADKGEFNRFIKRQGCYAWLAGVGSLDDVITRKWNSEMPVHFAIDYIGTIDMKEYIDGSNLRVYLMPDRIMLPGKNEKQAEDQIFWLDNNYGLYLIPNPRLNYTTEGILPSLDALNDLKEITSRPEHKMCLGWFVAIPWMHEIQKRLGGFPILWISGQTGTGKTTFVSFLMGIHYPLTDLKETIDAFLSPARTTPEGVSRALARYSGLPVLFDDLRMNSKYMEEYMELMRVLYDRFSIQKGRLRTRDSLQQAYEFRKMRAALATTSQHPPEDEALNQRTLEIEFKKTYLKKEQLFAMRALIKDLYPIGLHFMSKALNEEIGKELQEAMNILGPEATSSRKLQAYAVACAGLLKIGYSSKEIKGFIKAMNVSHESLSIETDEIEEFFEYIRTAASAKPMEVKRFVGFKDGGYWLAPSQLYDITQIWHGRYKERISFTKKSIKRLLKAQEGIRLFKTKKGAEKEKPVYVSLGEGQSTTVRGIFFTPQSEMGQRIKQLFRSSDMDFDYAAYEDEQSSFNTEEYDQVTETQKPQESAEAQKGFLGGEF